VSPLTHQPGRIASRAARWNVKKICRNPLKPVDESADTGIIDPSAMGLTHKETN
jgi:hypothetical protein